MPPKLVVEFLADVPNAKAVMRSKAIGEPPSSTHCGYFAVLDALRAARLDARRMRPLLHDIPMTPRKPSIISKESGHDLSRRPLAFRRERFRRASIRVRGERIAEIAESLVRRRREGRGASGSSSSPAPSIRMCISTNRASLPARTSPRQRRGGARRRDHRHRHALHVTPPVIDLPPSRTSSSTSRRARSRLRFGTAASRATRSGKV